MKLNVFNRKKTALEKLTSTYAVKLDASASQLIMDVLAKLYDNPVDANDIADLDSYLKSWQICPNWINVLKTAQIFRDLCTDEDKYLHNDLWSKTPFANQDYIERKMCCLSQCYYFDGYSFENKDLVTKAYSKYAGSATGSIEQDEALEIIDYVSSTCASEIATLNQMLSDMNPLIK